MLELGFETIGNATIICYDGAPVLATDPWITPEAYFGSWGHSHAIPPDQFEAIKACEFVWFSHGHPDHLNGGSLPLFRGKRILLPDHAGGRIRLDLEQQGHNVQVLKDRQWVRLSEHVSVLCIADYNQDAVLLIDVGGKLLVNLNDAGDRGWGPFVRKVVAGYEESFLLALSGYGDADMINFFDEDGQRIPPLAAHRFPVGQQIARKTAIFGCKYFIPSSSMHRYQRADSIWANEFTTALADYGRGFDSTRATLLPAFVQYDCRANTFRALQPPANDEVVRQPAEFGDNWDDVLDPDDVARIERYFKSVPHLATYLDFINLRVGGRDNFVSLAARKFNRGITFEVPRGSLMTAVEYEVFDDLLIGNFMKTTLHGKWPRSGLYPDFSPYVAKYADNGRARTPEELAAYFADYRRRAPVDYLRHRLEEKSKDIVRGYLPPESGVFQATKKLYWYLKSA